MIDTNKGILPSGRHSLFLQKCTTTSVVSPVRKNFFQKQKTHNGVSQSSDALPFGQKPPKYVREVDHLDVEDVQTTDYSIQNNLNIANVIKKNRQSMKMKHTKMTVTTASDASTTIMGQSQPQSQRDWKDKKVCSSANFTRYTGGGIMSDTTRSKQSIDFGAKKR